MLAFGSMSDASEYYLLVDNETHGPFPRAQLVAGLASGEVPRDTPTATVDDPEWKPISSVIQIATTDQPEAMTFGKTVKLPPLSSLE